MGDFAEFLANVQPDGSIKKPGARTRARAQTEASAQRGFVPELLEIRLNTLYPLISDLQRIANALLLGRRVRLRFADHAVERSFDWGQLTRQQATAEAAPSVAIDMVRQLRHAAGAGVVVAPSVVRTEEAFLASMVWRAGTLAQWRSMIGPPP